MSVDIQKHGGFDGKRRQGLIHWRLFSLLSGYDGNYKYRNGYVQHNTEDDMVFSWLIDIHGWSCLTEGWVFASLARALPEADFSYTAYLTSEVGPADESNNTIIYENGVLYFASTQRRVINKSEIYRDQVMCEDLEDKVFMIIGEPEYFGNRDELIDYIDEHGGKVTDSMSSETDYLIYNDISSKSSEIEKAKELGVSVITEEEFALRFGDPDDVDFDYLYEIFHLDDDEEEYDDETVSFQCKIDKEGNIIDDDDLSEECLENEQERLSELIDLIEEGTDNPTELMSLGMLFETGLAGVERNLKTAWDYYLKAAETGDKNAVSFVIKIFLSENKDELRELLKNKCISKEAYPVFFDLAVKTERPELTAELLEYRKATEESD